MIEEAKLRIMCKRTEVRSDHFLAQPSSEKEAYCIGVISGLSYALEAIEKEEETFIVYWKISNEHLPNSVRVSTVEEAKDVRNFLKEGGFIVDIKVL